MKTMNRIFKYAFWKLKRKKVYALVGKSGTGKSFRSKLVAQKHRIELIIDDGLLIRGNRILAGKSAKREANVLGAVRTAVFDDEDHRNETREALSKERFSRILIIGTSEKMVYKIAERLDLPQPERLFHIEDIATREQIDTAMRIRYAEGKHVIPVPSIEITRNYPQIVYDTMRVFSKKKLIDPRKKNRTIGFEKTIVRPEFSKYGETKVSEAALTQMVAHCLDEFDSQIKVKRVKVDQRSEGYALTVTLRTPMQHQISTTLRELQEYIADSLEKYGSIFVHSVHSEIEEWG